MSSLTCKSVNIFNFEPILPKEDMTLEETLRRYPTLFTSKTISDFDIDFNVPEREAIMSFLNY